MKNFSIKFEVYHLVLESGAEWFQSDPYISPCDLKPHLNRKLLDIYWRCDNSQILTKTTSDRYMIHLFHGKVCQKVVHQDDISRVLGLQHLS